MGKIGYLFVKIKWLLCHRNPEVINDYFRKCGASIGTNTHIFADISLGEPYLISIGSNVTISSNVSFITHDASVRHYIEDTTDVFGKIKIGNNVFIGMNAIILPGVTISDNCVIGAGSVVTRSIDNQGTVWVGNPARYIGAVESIAQKYKEFAVNLKSAKNKKEYIKNCSHIVR